MPAASSCSPTRTPDAPLLSTATVPDVRAELESGLMGIAIHDDAVYVCASRDPGGDGGDPWRVDLLMATLAADGGLSAFTPLPIGPTLGGPRHQGCAVEIGPDDHLWVTIGDANLSGDDNPAQDPAILNGKVLRLELDGSVPEDAPFASGAVSIGHRNPQGIAFRDDGLVLEVEHGTDENDEINRILAGANYGYPCVTGDGIPGPIPDACASDAVLSPPAWKSGNPTIATSGAAFLDRRHVGRLGGRPRRHDAQGRGPASLRGRCRRLRHRRPRRCSMGGSAACGRPPSAPTAPSTSRAPTGTTESSASLRTLSVRARAGRLGTRGARGWEDAPR